MENFSGRLVGKRKALEKKNWPGKKKEGKRGNIFLFVLEEKTKKKKKNTCLKGKSSFGSCLLTKKT